MTKPAKMEQAPDFSLVLGGPFYQLWRRAHLAGDALQLLRRRVAVLALLAWAPLLVLSVVEGHFWGASVKLPLKGNFHAELQAGARLWYVSSDFELQSSSGLPSVDSGRSETWVTPLVGANLRYDLPHNWLLLVQGTAGGFSGDSLQWDVFGGVGYRFNKWCLVTLGYRYLREDYKNGSFTFNAEAQGVLFGAVFRF